MQTHGEVVWDPLVETAAEGETFLGRLCGYYGNSSSADEGEGGWE